MSAHAADADAAWAAWVAAEVATWPPLHAAQVEALRVLLDLRADPVDVLAVKVLPPALLSESDGAVTVGIRAANPPATPFTETSPITPEAVQS